MDIVLATCLCLHLALLIHGESGLEMLLFCTCRYRNPSRGRRSDSFPLAVTNIPLTSPIHCMVPAAEVWAW